MKRGILVGALIVLVGLVAVGISAPGYVHDLTSAAFVKAGSYLQSGTYTAVGSYLTVGSYATVTDSLRVGSTFTANGRVILGASAAGDSYFKNDSTTKSIAISGADTTSRYVALQFGTTAADSCGRIQAVPIAGGVQFVRLASDAELNARFFWVRLK